MSLRFHFSQQHASFSDKAAARLKLADVCPDCGLDDAIVEDHHRGTRVCQRCSVCVELGMIRFIVTSTTFFNNERMETA